jgi:hypothetical protein
MKPEVEEILKAWIKWSDLRHKYLNNYGKNILGYFPNYNTNRYYNPKYSQN